MLSVDSVRLLSDIKLAEGCKLYAYKDSLGLWTGGYGHLLDQGKDWTGVTFTQQQADDWLAEDIASNSSLAQTLLEWSSLDVDSRQNAIVELVFNMGLSHWKQFAHCRCYLSHKDWSSAKLALLDSLWAKQVGPHRSQRIANYIESGDF